MFELKVRDHIAAAHYLRGYEGPCKELHGHTWQIEITVMSENLNDMGLVVDFKDIKKRLKSFLDQLDHVCLNDLPAFDEENPTTENIAKFIYQNFAKDLKPLTLKSVQVWESDTASITYYE